MGDVQLRNGKGLGEDLNLGEPSCPSDKINEISVVAVSRGVARLVGVGIGSHGVQVVSAADTGDNVVNSGLDISKTVLKVK